MYSAYWPFAKARVGMEVLKREDGIWKIHNNKWIPGQMFEELKKNPTDASLYYLYTNDIINEHFPVYRFKKKYYELDPEGFWVTKSFLEKLKTDKNNYETNYEKYERELLSQMKTYGAARRAREYINLARISMYRQDNNKAEKYLDEAESALRQGKYIF